MWGTSALRKLIGFFVAPAPTLIVMVMAQLNLRGQFPSMTIFFVGLGLLLSAQVLFGVPLVAIFKRRGLVQAMHYALGGGAIMLCLLLSLLGMASATGGARSLSAVHLVLLPVYTIAAAATGLTYWAIVRPDRNSPADPRRVRTIFS